MLLRFLIYSVMVDAYTVTASQHNIAIFFISSVIHEVSWSKHLYELVWTDHLWGDLEYMDEGSTFFNITILFRANTEKNGINLNIISF